MKLSPSPTLFEATHVRSGLPNFETCPYPNRVEEIGLAHGADEQLQCEAQVRRDGCRAAVREARRAANSQDYAGLRRGHDV